MDILYLLIPIAMLLVVLIVVIFMWAVRSGQFDDLEGPAHRVLTDDEIPKSPNDTESKDDEGEKSD